MWINCWPIYVGYNLPRDNIIGVTIFILFRGWVEEGVGKGKGRFEVGLR